MSRSILAVIFAAIWSLITILSLTWGFEFNWPDYVHTNYGLPLIWGTHTTNTIHGPVDVWKINIVYLVIDLAIWLSMLVLALPVILYVKIRR